MNDETDKYRVVARDIDWKDAVPLCSPINVIPLCDDLEKEVCPICDEGTLSPAKYDDIFSGVIVKDLDCCECNVCDADPVNPEQIKSNFRKIQKAIKEYIYE